MITAIHVITKLELGGAQENTLFTCRHLDRQCFRVALVHGPGGLLDPEADRIPDVERFVVPELVRSVVPSRDVLALTRLRAVFADVLRRHRAAGFDTNAVIVHTHSSKAGIIGRLAARWVGIPKVIHHIHGFGFFSGQAAARRLAFLGAERATARLADGFISVSEASLAEAEARGLVLPHHPRVVIRSGMDLEAFRQLRDRKQESRAELGVAPGRRLVVCIANLKPQKDPLTLVEAARRLCRRRPDVDLWYAGDGPLREDVEAAIQRAGLDTSFRLLGWRRDIPRLMAAADVVTLSSLFEGLPRTAVQALAVARPFVGTRVDGTPEVIRDGKNGFLVEPRDPGALADALEAALDEQPVDPSDDARLEAWEGHRMVEAQEAFYRRLLAG